MAIPCANCFIVRPYLFLYIFLIMPPHVIMLIIASSDSDAEALLKLKDSFDNPQPLDSWKRGTEPCDKVTRWIGVVCGNGMVTDLRLRELGLSGKIDVHALAQIEGLRTISLDNNSFSGPIPEFYVLSHLKAIYLTGNQFSGEVPQDYFVKMVSLKKVWLAGNSFTGKIPSSLSQLPNLMDLHVEDNRFSGTIPSLDQQTLESIGFSNNQLTGEIPPSLSRFDASAFQGNPGLCGAKIAKTCDQAAENPLAPDGGNESKSIAFGLMIVAGFILSLMILGIYMLLRQRRKETFEEIEMQNFEGSVEVSLANVSKKDTMGSSNRRSLSSSRKGQGNGNKGAGDLVLVNEDKGVFGLADLMKAAAEVLGNGALGSSYKAQMANGLSVVVKRLKDMNKMGKDGFDAEMKRLGRLKHPNILTPLAYHYRKEEKLLVYEFIPKGSLLYLLHGDRGLSHAELTWPVRLKIIRGIARGLGYLHTELAILDLPHGDLKSSNVLVDSDFEPLLADYGFSSLVNTNQCLQSLIAYKSPEAAPPLCQVSPKCDVYCLGIIILEIITGKFPCQYLSNGKGGTDLVEWVKSATLEGREGDLFDPDISGSSKDCLVQMEKLLHVGAACTESKPEERLDIREAVRRIEEVGGGGKEDRAATYQVLPSLRDGYADAHHVSFIVTERSGSSSRQESAAATHAVVGSGRQNNDDGFAFDIS